MAGVETASNTPSNLVSLYLAESGMLVRNKKITATAQLGGEDTEKPQTYKCKG